MHELDGDRLGEAYHRSLGGAVGFLGLVVAKEHEAACLVRHDQFFREQATEQAEENPHGRACTAAAPSISPGMAMDMTDDANELAGLAPDEVKMARNERVVKTSFWRKARSTLGKVSFTEDAVAAYYCATDRNTSAYSRQSSWVRSPISSPRPT